MPVTTDEPKTGFELHREMAAQIAIANLPDLAEDLKKSASEHHRSLIERWGSNAWALAGVFLKEGEKYRPAQSTEKPPVDRVKTLTKEELKQKANEALEDAKSTSVREETAEDDEDEGIIVRTPAKKASRK